MGRQATRAGMSASPRSEEQPRRWLRAATLVLAVLATVTLAHVALATAGDCSKMP